MGYFKQKTVEEQSSAEYDEYVALQRKPKFTELWAATLDVFDLMDEDLASGLSRRATEARHVLWNALNILGWSASDIGEKTGGFDRTSIYPALRNLEAKGKARALIVLVEREARSQSKEQN